MYAGDRHSHIPYDTRSAARMRAIRIQGVEMSELVKAIGGVSGVSNSGVVDWFNPLVGHMQHSIRDPNRDHSHGRIWRVHYTKKPLVKPVKIAGEEIATLLDYLKSVPEERTRERVRLELRSRDRKEVLAAATKWLAGIDKNHKDYEHHRLEVLWMHQQQDVVDENLLKQVLASPDYRARSAAESEQLDLAALHAKLGISR